MATIPPPTLPEGQEPSAIADMERRGPLPTLVRRAFRTPWKFATANAWPLGMLGLYVLAQVVILRDAYRWHDLTTLIAGACFGLIWGAELVWDTVRDERRWERDLIIDMLIRTRELEELAARCKQEAERQANA